MAQRSILAGKNPSVIIKAGASVTVKGVDGDRITAEGKWDLKVEKRSEAEFARARAAIGEVVLFDWRFKKPNLGGRDDEEVYEVQFGGSGEVLVPFGSNLKIYAGKDIDAAGIRGKVDAFAGHDLSMRDVYCLGNASAGRGMNLDCQTLLASDVIYSAGSDFRFHAADLNSLRLRVKDIGGYWEARIGAGEKSIYLKSGGEVIFVTDLKVEALPPDYILGKIERSSAV